MACEICHETYVSAEDNPSDSDAKPHLCTTCGQSFSLKIQLKRHTLLHADGVPYTCVKCLKVSDTKGKTYNLRLGNKNEYVCDICQESFSNKRMLLRHSIQHTFDKISDTEEFGEEKEEVKKSIVAGKRKYTRRKSVRKEKYVCNFCERAFLSNAALEKHSLIHNLSKASCKSCNKVFAYQACLEKHISKGKCNAPVQPASVDSKDKSSDVDKKHICGICGKSFARKSSLEGHELSHILDKVTSEEEKDDSIVEISDNEEFVSKPKKSRLSTFNFQKSYTCVNCNFVCFSKLTLNKHLASHEETELGDSEVKQNDENHDVCDKEDSKKESRKSVTNPYECDKCIKKFKTEKKLFRHAFVHHEENELKSLDDSSSFSCEICHKHFSSKQELKQHLLLHVGRVSDKSSPRKWSKEPGQRGKNFVCELCGKRFAGEKCLKKHALKHEEGNDDEIKIPSVRVKKSKPVKELICEFCNETFTGKKSVYIKHIHAHTPEVCGICDERFIDRQSLREHCKIHVGTEEGRMFMQCSQKALDAKNGLNQLEPKVEYIYLVLR